MNKNYSFKSCLGEIDILFDVDERFSSIKTLLENVPRSKATVQTNLRIIIQYAQERKVYLSDDRYTLTIQGDTIDHLDNPFNLVGILQAIIRFTGLHSTQHGIVLLHGSAAVYEGKAICFGDDGLSNAKTLSSLEIALCSHRYIGDEFLFLDTISKKIHGCPYNPLHIRDIVKEHLESVHNYQLLFTGFTPSQAGNFINPSKLFTIDDGKKLHAFIFVYFQKPDSSPKVYKLTRSESYIAVKNMVAAHIIKLLYPQFDRMQFTEQRDVSDQIDYGKDLVNKVIGDMKAEEHIEKIAAIPCYRFYITDPCEIPVLCKQL